VHNVILDDAIVVAVDASVRSSVMVIAGTPCELPPPSCVTVIANSDASRTVVERTGMVATFAAVTIVLSGPVTVGPTDVCSTEIMTPSVMVENSGIAVCFVIVADTVSNSVIIAFTDVCSMRDA
jgi:hypothetical protein